MELLRVLIADDEAAARAALRTLDWQKHGCVLVGEAEDGEQVLDILSRIPVDAVLLDIGMPVMNGLELAPMIGQMYPGVKVIFLTMYREFDYAVEAMRRGAMDYLIKDVADPEKIFAALDRVRTSTRTDLISYELSQEKMLRERMQTVRTEPLPCLHPVRMLRLLRKNDAQQHCPMYSTSKILLGLPGCTACLPVMENLWLLFGKGTDHEVLRYLESHFGQAYQVTTALEGFADISAAISKGEAYLEEGFYHPERRLLSDGGYAEAFPPKMMAEFQTDIRSCFYDVSHNPNTLNEWLQKCAEQHIAPAAVRQLLISMIPVSTASRSDSSGLTAALGKAYTASEAAALFRGHLLKVRLSGAGRRIEIQQVEDYIRTHLDENLSLQTLSSQVGLSPNYLNHLFREEMHETLKSYVMRIRMETAAAMLRGSDMRINEIARQVGFPTARYFSDAFSKYYGVIPKDYRKG